LDKQAALQLHVRVDELASFGQAGVETLLTVLVKALTSLALANRISLSGRLKRVVHESIAEAAGDPVALASWSRVLHDGLGCSPRTSSSECWPACPAGQVGPAIWTRVLAFTVSISALAQGLHCVSRGFRRLLAQPACWRGHDITVAEHHLHGLSLSGCSVWGKAFTLLPALKEARTLRVASFADSTRRLQVLPPLRSACSALCPNMEMLSCSFCEHHHGDLIELPTPRKLSARRRADASKGGGLLLATGPLRESAGNCRSFGLRIEHLMPGERLDIGVTSMATCEHFADRLTQRHVSLAEDLLKSWIVESSGLLVGSHAGLRIRDRRWDARSLRSGDVVQVTVMPTGELTLSVNGAQRGSWGAMIPGNVLIYPVVDLFEGTPHVQLVPDDETFLPMV